MSRKRRKKEDMSKLNKAKIVLAYLKGVYEDPRMLTELDNSILALEGRRVSFDTTRVIEILNHMTKVYSDPEMINSMNLAVIKLRRVGVI